MEKYNLMDDLTLFYITAKSFPDGIEESFRKLEKLLPTKEGRTFYGISRPEKNNTIIYKAAVAEIFEGEGKKYGCETFILKKGEYLTETIKDWNQKAEIIMPTFYTLLDAPHLDPESHCVEWMRNEDELVCMVRLEK